MKNWQSTLRALVLVGTGLMLPGCPLVLDDNFKTEAAASGASANGGQNGNGGQGNRGGMMHVEAGAPGSAAVAGEQATGGSGATSGQGGSGAVGPEAGAAGMSGEAGAPNPDPCALCSPKECCNGQCVDLRFDANHCRECMTGCPGTTCDNSSCTNTCAQGFIDCNQNVVDGCEVNPATNAENCGNCKIVCGFQLECEAGYCVCPAGTADCDGNKDNGCETDTTSDKASCGGCGKACSPNQGCVNSVCGCELGFSDCNLAADDGCEADLTATATCGSCALDCGPHGSCVAAGQCDCVPEYLDCDSGTPGCETPLTDPNHCGDCDTACTVQTPVCNGIMCITGCGVLTRCNDSCVDTDIDPENCGSCGKAVGLNQICQAGLPVCVTGYDDCDAVPTDCEVNTETDALNCGGCDSPCKSGALCDAGTCACAPTTPNDCGASCEQCCNDTQCTDGDSCTADTCSAGVCGFGLECATGGTCCSGTGCFECCSDDDCVLGEMCSDNQCVALTCIPPQIVCNLKCVNPEIDANNCGGCGNRCGPGRTCFGSSCTPKWVPTTPPLVSFVAREKAAYTAMGSKVFIWGGNNAAAQNLNDGAIYDPETDTWAAVAATGTPPSARVLATAVWTGSVVVVWGGGDAADTMSYGTGSRYDPATNSWQAMSNVGAPSGRRAAYGFWTGSRVLFYAGVDTQGNPRSELYLYDPVNDAWSSTTSDNRPQGRANPTLGWTGSLLIVYGGRIGGTAYDETFTYEVATNDWDGVADGPLTRHGALGTWDGTYLLAWSGWSFTQNALRTDGRLYEPTVNTWTNMGITDDPAYRWAPHRQTGWSVRLKPRVTLMLGGTSTSNASTFLMDGGIYNSTTNVWTPVSAWPSGASHFWGVGVWTGTEFVVWGGRLGTSSTLTLGGERYFP